MRDRQARRISIGFVIDVVGAEVSPEQFLIRVQIFVQPVTRTDEPDAVGSVRFHNFLERRRHFCTGFLNTHRLPLLPGLSDPVFTLGEIVSPAGLVANPAVVHQVVGPGGDALHFVESCAERHVAVAGAMTAQGIGVGEIPRPRSETEIGIGECTNGTDIDHVAGEPGVVWLFVEGGHAVLESTVEHNQRLIFFNDVAVARTPLASDAPFAVDGNHRTERRGFFAVKTVVLHARIRRAELERVVLKRTLAALVAYRTIQRMVEESELQHALLRFFDFFRVGLDDHALTDRHRACSHHLRHLLHFDQTHPATAEGSEFFVVAENRNFYIHRFGGIHHHGPFGNRYGFAVDGQGDGINLSCGIHLYLSYRLLSFQGPD